MLDWEGNMIDRRHQKRLMHADNLYPEDNVPNVSSLDTIVDEALHEIPDHNPNVQSMAQNAILLLTQVVEERAQILYISIAIGSTGLSSAKDDLLIPPYDTPNCNCGKTPSTSAVAVGNPQSLSPQFLSKIWHIKHEDAKNVINQSTQLRRFGAQNELSKQIGTNDRMLRYRRIESTFFTDTFFVTAKGKSTRGNK